MTMVHFKTRLPASSPQPLRSSGTLCRQRYTIHCSHNSANRRTPGALARQEPGAAVSAGASILLTAALLLGAPSLTPPARAESAAETRRNAAEQRKLLLSQAREKALKNAFEISPSPADAPSGQPEESSAQTQAQPEVGNSFGFKDEVQKEQAQKSASRMQTQDLAPSTAAPIDEPRQPSPKAKASAPEPSKAVEADKAPASVFQSAKQGAEDAKEKAQEATKEAAKSVPKPAPPKAPEFVPSFSSKLKTQVQGESPLQPKPKAAIQGEGPKSIKAMKADLKKQGADKGKKQKRKGPLPMTVAQLLVLAFYGGLGYAVAVKDAEVRSVLRTAGKYIGQGYNKAIDSLPKQLKTKT